MSLLKFIEYQQRQTFLHRIPIPIKTIPLVYSIVSIFLPITRDMRMLSLAIVLATLTVLMLVAFRDPAYIAEVYFAYALLFIIAYVSEIIYGGDVWRLADRILYVCSVAFSSIFIFATTTTDALENFLKKIGFPRRILGYFSLTWNFIPSTYWELRAVMMAQEARGLSFGGNPIARLKKTISILIPFLSLLLIRLKILEHALRARGC